MATVSVAMATYNGGRYIAEQLESLLRQSVLPDELVVADDGSGDDTLAIIAAFAARAPFAVRVQRNTQHLGFRGNFMKAASLCAGDIIAFCDQDDVWFPAKLETCLAAFANAETLLVYHEAIIVTETLTPIGPLNKGTERPLNMPLSLDPTHFALGFTILFRRVLLGFDKYWLESADFYDSTKIEAHDQWFFFLASCLGWIAYISTPLAYYRRHAKNATRMNKAAGIVNKVKNILATNIAGIRSRELSAGKRAQALERMQESLEGVYRGRAATAVRLYRKFEMHYRLRQEIYAGSSFHERMGLFLRLEQMGGYQSRKRWGVGKNALVRDLICGVIVNRLKYRSYRVSPA